MLIIKSAMTNKVIAKYKCKSKAEAKRLAEFINDNMKSVLRYAEVE